MHFVFMKPKMKPGTVLESEDWDGDVYRFVLLGSEPIVTAKGNPTTLYSWAGDCVSCGEPFTATSGVNSKTLARHCAPCRNVWKATNFDTDGNWTGPSLPGPEHRIVREYRGDAEEIDPASLF